MKIDPVLSILPPEQKQLWPGLKDIPKDFVLYGGTAVALRFGHRESVDFDLFTSRQDYDLKKIGEAIPVIKQYPHETTLVAPGQVDILLLVEGKGVKMTFLSNRDIVAGSVNPPDTARDNNLKIASPLDLMACKVLALHNRSEAKDFFDVAEIIQHGVSLQKGFEAAYAVAKLSRLGTKQLMLERLKEDFRARSTEKILAEHPDKTIASKAENYAAVLKAAATQIDVAKVERTRIRATPKIECGPELGVER